MTAWQDLPTRRQARLRERGLPGEGGGTPEDANTPPADDVTATPVAEDAETAAPSTDAITNAATESAAPLETAEPADVTPQISPADGSGDAPRVPMTRRERRAMEAAQTGRLTRTGPSAPGAPASSAIIPETPTPTSPAAAEPLIEPGVSEQGFVIGHFSAQQISAEASQAAETSTDAPEVVPPAPAAQQPAPTVQPGAAQPDPPQQPVPLILPGFGASDLTRPLASTGEILITGSVDLPSSLGTVGTHPSRFDHSDIDAIFAAEDQEEGSTDSAPVRAIRAVSTHTSTQGVITAKKPASNKLPMIMAVTAGVLAVGVAALFIAGFVFGYF